MDKILCKIISLSSIIKYPKIYSLFIKGSTVLKPDAPVLYPAKALLLIITQGTLRNTPKYLLQENLKFDSNKKIRNDLAFKNMSKKQIEKSNIIIYAISWLIRNYNHNKVDSRLKRRITC